MLEIIKDNLWLLAPIVIITVLFFARRSNKKYIETIADKPASEYAISDLFLKIKSYAAGEGKYHESTNYDKFIEHPEVKKLLSQIDSGVTTNAQLKTINDKLFNVRTGIWNTIIQDLNNKETVDFVNNELAKVKGASSES